MFEIQHYTICDGWINTWSICDDEIPERFQSYDEALIALNEHIDDIKFEYKAGNIADLYTEEQFRIKEVTA